MVSARGRLHVGRERLGYLARDSVMALTYRTRKIDSRSSSGTATCCYFLKGYRAPLERPQRPHQPSFRRRSVGGVG